MLLDHAISLHWLAGELGSSVDAFREQLAWTGGYSRRKAWGASVAAISAAELSDEPEARSIVRAMTAVFGGRDWQLQSDLARWGRGVVAWLHGDGATAVNELTAAVRRQTDGGWGGGPYTRLMLADLAEISAHAGDTSTGRLVDGFLDEIDEGAAGDPLAGVALLARGGAALARGDHDEAAEQLRAAADDLARAGWPLLHGRALALLGRAAAAHSDRDVALDALRQAGELFETCGAVARRGWVLEDMRRLGARGRRASGAVAGPAALTRREREVARLAAEGRSAKEIAEALFIGKRTVETHLAGAYAKLGVSSQVELVRLAPDLDL
jgi:DNA-binding CsgD family transcriptional regulator